MFVRFMQLPSCCRTTCHEDGSDKSRQVFKATDDLGQTKHKTPSASNRWYALVLYLYDLHAVKCCKLGCQMAGSFSGCERKMSNAN